MVIVICPVIVKLKELGDVNLQNVIDELEDVIVEEYDSSMEITSYKGAWIKRIATAADLLNTDIVSVGIWVPSAE